MPRLAWRFASGDDMAPPSAEMPLSRKAAAMPRPADVPPRAAYPHSAEQAALARPRIAAACPPTTHRSHPVLQRCALQGLHHITSNYSLDHQATATKGSLLSASRCLRVCVASPSIRTSPTRSNGRVDRRASRAFRPARRPPQRRNHRLSRSQQRPTVPSCGPQAREFMVSMLMRPMQR